MTNFESGCLGPDSERKETFRSTHLPQAHLVEVAPLRKPYRRFPVQLSVEIQAVVPPNACGKRRERVPKVSLGSDDQVGICTIHRDGLCGSV